MEKTIYPAEIDLWGLKAEREPGRKYFMSQEQITGDHPEHGPFSICSNLGTPTHFIVSFPEVKDADGYLRYSVHIPARKLLDALFEAIEQANKEKP